MMNYKPSRCIWLCLAALVVAGCGLPAALIAPDAGASVDGAGEGGRPFCTADSSCVGPASHCDPSGHCAVCLVDAHCPDGQVCRGGECVAGCTDEHGCGSAGGSCQLDAGQCRTCAVDGDCGDPALPRCDPTARACVECLPPSGDAPDSCPAGRYCGHGGASYACVPGCGRDADCLRQRDGGGASCCDHACVDLTVDGDNCGACGNSCKGGGCCGSACVDLSADVGNCGACGNHCLAVHDAPACSAGHCTVGTCDAGHADCNLLASDGCEVDVSADPQNCLGCGNVCGASHATTTCSGGCAIGQCDPGYADCNHKYGDGCETPIGSDLMNCGGCGVSCGPLANASASCASGACTIARCNEGFLDCNQSAADGCEVNGEGDLQSCGACGQGCPPIANGAVACLMGACGVGACNAPFADCNADPRDGCEANPTVDPANCGGCGRACAPVPNGVGGCVNGGCALASCNASFKDCNGDLGDGCEVNLGNDPSNCGACGHACSAPPNAAPSCSGGQCSVGECKAPFRDCDGNPATGCETDTSKNVKHCGDCNTQCAAVAHGSAGCAAGECGVGVCSAPFKDCNKEPEDGCETNTNTDAANCGACGKVCAAPPNATPGCTAGGCGVGQCKGSFLDCNKNAVDGCEIDGAGSAANCGACGKACPAVANGTPGCASSKCGIGSCNAGFFDCDKDPANGCELNGTADNNNCGGCGVKCAANQACQNSQCVVILYAPSGVQQNVQVASLTGWTQCYKDAYNVNLPVAQLLGACTKAKLMLACRQTNSLTAQLLAWAPRADVTFNTGQSNTPHNANGVGWYYSPTFSWGFAPQGDSINRSQCDTTASSQMGGPDGAQRLCWHTGMGIGGWRCGKNDSLNNSTAYERIVYQAD